MKAISIGPMQGKATARKSKPAKLSNVLTIRSAILSHFSQVVGELKLDPIARLRRAGIDRRCLTNPNIPIPLAKANALITETALAANCTTLGIGLALARGMPDIGPLNLLLREEPNLRAALRSLQSFLHVHSRSMQIVLEERDDLAILRSHLASLATDVSSSQSMEMIICGLLQTVKWLAGERWKPSLICFSHPGPKDIRAHRALLGSPVEFGHSFDGFVLPPADLDLPIANASPLLRKYAEDHVRALAVGSGQDFAEVVSGLISALLPSGRCSSTAVSRHLGMERTTLSRRLAKVQSSYSDLLQATRMTLAQRCFLAGWPAAKVADHLGFADMSVFSRWFSTSFGCSATAWRNTHLGQP